MLIANPIYDVVFRYLLKDEKAAKLLLSAITGEEIIELNVRPIGREVGTKSSWMVVDIGFSAKIKSENGREKQVTIKV